MHELFRPWAISVGQNEGTASGFGQMSGQGLADPAAAQKKNPTLSEVDFPSLIDGSPPSQGIRATAVQLLSFHPHGVDGLRLRGGRIHAVHQIEHGVFVGQSAVPPLETRLFQARNGEAQILSRDFDAKVFGIQT